MASKRIKIPFPKGTYYLSGNEAAAEGAIATGFEWY